MARKSNPSKARKLGPPATPRKHVLIDPGTSAHEGFRNYAESAVSPELAASRIFRAVERESGLDKDLDVPILMQTLRDQAAAVNQGDLSRAEAMLMGQATALQTIFVRLTECGLAGRSVAAG